MTASDRGSGEMDPPSDELPGTDRGPGFPGDDLPDFAASSSSAETSFGCGCDNADLLLLSRAFVIGDWRTRAAAPVVPGLLRLEVFLIAGVG